MWAMGVNTKMKKRKATATATAAAAATANILGEQGGIGGCWWGSGCVRVITDLAKILILCGPLQLQF